MKRVLYLLGFLLIIYSQGFTQEQAGKKSKGTLIVVITGLQNDNGDVRIGLFQNAESFDGKEEKFTGAILPAQKPTVIWTVPDVPFGTYAIKVFHDEDQDDEIDTKFGLPSEAFGFSNNPSILLGPPGFNRAKFLFQSDSMKVEIKLIHF